MWNCLLGAQVARILNRTVAGFTAGVIDAVRPCPGAGKTYRPHAPIECCLERVVRGVAPRNDTGGIAEVRIRTAAHHGAWAGDRLIDIQSDNIDIGPFAADIRNRQHQVAAEVPVAR